MLFEKAEMIVWLDLPLSTCLWRSLKRSVTRSLKKESCCNGNNETFWRLFGKNSILLWVWQTYHRRKQKYSELFAHPPPKQQLVRLKSQFDVKRFIIQPQNNSKFCVVRALKLPPDQYAITGSGALGIRNLRKIGDITPSLWQALQNTYGMTNENQKKIVFPDGVVEAFGRDSLEAVTQLKNTPPFLKRIQDAEMIDWLPFKSLENLLFFKKNSTHQKDRQNCVLIDTLLTS